MRRRKQSDTIKGTADEHAHVNNRKYSSTGIKKVIKNEKYIFVLGNNNNANHIE